MFAISYILHLIEINMKCEKHVSEKLFAGDETEKWIRVGSEAFPVSPFKAVLIVRHFAFLK